MRRFQPFVALLLVLLLSYGADLVMREAESVASNTFIIGPVIWLNRGLLLGFAIIMLWFAWLTLVKLEVRRADYWAALIIGSLIVFLVPIRSWIDKIIVFRFPHWLMFLVRDENAFFLRASAFVSIIGLIGLLRNK